jgi:hypothetical protein
LSIFNDAHVVVLLADYIGIDASGKVNALGAGFGLTFVGPNGLTAPQHVVVMIDVPAKYSGQQFALTLELRNETTGQPVMLATDPAGNLQPLRIQQVAQVQGPSAPGLYLPTDQVMARVQLPVAFMDGLPLQPGNAYAWRVQIDAQSRPGWKASFYVPGPPPGPVIGGPHGPADIPNVAPFTPPAEGGDAPGTNESQ